LRCDHTRRQRLQADDAGVVACCVLMVQPQPIPDALEGMAEQQSLEPWQGGIMLVVQCLMHDRCVGCWLGQVMAG
jgi:hypothetical protein